MGERKAARAPRFVELHFLGDNAPFLVNAAFVTFAAEDTRALKRDGPELPCTTIEIVRGDSTRRFHTTEPYAEVKDKLEAAGGRYA